VGRRSADEVSFWVLLLLGIFVLCFYFLSQRQANARAQGTTNAPHRGHQRRRARQTRALMRGPLVRALSVRSGGQPPLPACASQRQRRAAFASACEAARGLWPFVAGVMRHRGGGRSSSPAFSGARLVGACGAGPPVELFAADRCSQWWRRRNAQTQRRTRHTHLRTRRCCAGCSSRILRPTPPTDCTSSGW